MAREIYYYIDIDLKDMRIVEWGSDTTATLTGETNDPHVHRIFISKGQYNKLIRHVE